MNYACAFSQSELGKFFEWIVNSFNNCTEIHARKQTRCITLEFWSYGRPIVSKFWHDISAVFSHVYLQSFLLHDIRTFFRQVCLRSFLLCGVFIPKYMTIFLQTRIYMPTKKPIYMRYKQACGMWGHRKSSYKRHRIILSAKQPLHVRWSWKVTSVWIKRGRNGSVNFVQGLVLIHCPHSSGGCRLPDNGFVGIRGLSLERLCMLFHKCWPKQRSIQLESRHWENSRQLCKPSTSSPVFITVSNSPNPSRVYIRLCKHRKRFLLLL